MQARQAAFSRWSLKRSLSIALAAALLCLPAAFDNPELSFVLLAGTGMAAFILLAAGYLTFSQDEERFDDRARRLFSALPSPVAVTTIKGLVLWRTEEFAAILGSACERDFSKLGEINQEISAALFRLFSAARRGHAHAETLAPPAAPEGSKFVLQVTPWGGGARRTPLLIWHLCQNEPAPAQAAPVAPNADESLLETIPAPALLISNSMSIKGINRAFAKLFGYVSAAALNGPLWGLLRSQNGEPFTRASLSELVAGSDAPFAVQMPAPNGALRFAIVHMESGTQESPSQANTRLCVLTPVPAFADGAASALEQFFAHSPMAIAIVNKAGEVRAANPAFARVFAGTAGNSGIPSIELHGKALSDLVSEPSSAVIKTSLNAAGAASGPSVAPVEVSAHLKGEADKYVRLIFAPTPDESQVIVFAMEAANAAVLDEQTIQSQKLQAVGELAGGIAHDFNNLLTAIIGFSDLLLARFRASDPAFKDVMNIKNNANRAAELVRHILAYSRRQTLRPTILTLTDVIEDFHSSMGRLLGEKVKARILHGRDLWFVHADESQLFQVIMNLAVNARDAMPNGGELTIRTANISERESLALLERGLERGEYVMCEVSDTGTGIKPEHLKKIFDPFFSTKEVGKGTGLGLSTVYGIVKQTGGTILVDSKMGSGASFRIYLPRYVETEDDVKALEHKAEVREKSADLTGTSTVLLVEDEEAVRSFASRALSTRGYTVLEASSGVEALEVMDREKGEIDLVVSDVVMPEMDGPTLLRHLRKRKPDIKVVFMSGYAEEAFRKNLSEDEDFIFLPKPFTLKKLAETVKAAAP